MKTVLEKLKPIGILFLMIFACIGVVWVTNQFKSLQKDSSAYNNTSLLAEITTEDFFIHNSLPQEVHYSEPSNEFSGVEVLGQTTSCGSAVEIQTESICYRVTARELDYKDGERQGTQVRKDANIELEYVRVPLELFSGMEVADSNRKITSQTPTFKAAGEQFDDLSVNVLLPPGNQISTYKESTELEDEPFTTPYSVGRGGNSGAEISEEGQIGVNTKLENACDSQEYNNKSNVTPSKSNGRAELKYDQVRYPNEKKLQEEQEMMVEECNESNDRFIQWDTDFRGCYVGLFQRVVSFFKNVFDSEWEDCQINDTGCMYVEDIVLIMASPFGSSDGCGDDGACTNAYMNRRNNIVQGPSAGTSGKVYYTTDCEVRIGRPGPFRRQLFTVKCAWDMTHLYKELEVSKFDDSPNVEFTPTPEEYDRFLQEEVRGRRDNPISL